MDPSEDELNDQLVHSAYPRSAGFDARWVIDNQMGPNALSLMEALTQVMPIERDMMVLELGCGRAITSIFLAKEFGARACGLRISRSPPRTTTSASVRSRIG